MENQDTSAQQVNQQFAQQFGQQNLPNATAVLVLGIISIVGCFCYGIIGLILGIVALVLAGKANKQYQENSAMYSQASYKNMKAGRVCAIIGTSLSAVYLLVIIIYIAVLGTVLTATPWNMLGR